MAQFDPNVVDWKEIVAKYLLRPGHEKAGESSVLGQVLQGGIESAMDLGTGQMMGPFGPLGILSPVMKGLTGSTPEEFIEKNPVTGEAQTVEQKAARIGGSLVPYGAFGIATQPLAVAGEKYAASRLGSFAASRLGKFAQAAAGQVAQEAAFVPSTLASSDSIKEAAAYSVLGVGIGSLFGRTLKQELTDKVAKNLLENRPATEEVSEIAEVIEKELVEAGAKAKNLGALEVLNTTAPPQVMLPELGKSVSENDLKSLDSLGENIRLKNRSVGDIAETESNDTVAEILTADGPITTKAALFDKLNKIYTDMRAKGQISMEHSILDEIRPSASLAERKYILLNADTETFRHVSTRLKTPERVQLKLIEKAMALPVEQRGQFLFNSIVEQSHIARLRGDVDVYQVPARNPDFEKYQTLRFEQEEELGKYRNADEALREVNRATGNSFSVDSIEDPSIRRDYQLLARSQAVPSLEYLEQVRLNRLNTLSQVLKTGDFATADKMLGRHVGQTVLRKGQEQVQKELSDLALFSESPVLKAFADIPIALRFVSEEIGGGALHFPESEWIPILTGGRAREAVLLDINEAADLPQDILYTLRHEYSHSMWDYIKKLEQGEWIRKYDAESKMLQEGRMGDYMASANNTEKGPGALVYEALTRASKAHTFRAWDPILEAIAKKHNLYFPPLEKRIGLPGGFFADLHSEHAEKMEEKIADILALMTTKEGRESLNPLVRRELEPIFGKIKEPYKPRYVLSTEEIELYGGSMAGPGGKGFIKGPEKNTVKNAGKVLTTPAQEAQIKFAALNAATDPETGRVPPAAQGVISKSGPVAADGLGGLIDGAGPFQKGKFVANVGEPLADKLTLKDFFLAAKTIRAAGLVSGVATNLANVLSDFVQAAIQVPITAMAAGVDIAKVATGVQKNRQLFLGEALAQAKGQLSQAFGINAALPTALRDFGREIREANQFLKGYESASNKDYLNKIVSAQQNEALKQSLGVVERVVKVPFNVLRAVDNYFFNINFAGNMYKEAYARSIKEGKSFSQAIEELSNTLGKFDKETIELLSKSERQAIDELKEGADIETQMGFLLEGGEREFIEANKEEIKNLSKQYAMKNIPQSMEDAKHAAERSIFVAREGKLLDRVLSGLDRWDEDLYGLISLALPFKRTPAYIIREGLRTSPFGFLPFVAQALGKSNVPELGSREASLLLGQAAFGTLAFYGLWQHIANGNIEGMPSEFNPNRAQRDTYGAAGQKPGTIKLKAFGKEYTVPLDRVQPLGATIDALLGYKKDLEAAKKAGEPLDMYHATGAALAWDFAKKLGIGDFSRNVGDFLEIFQLGPEIGAGAAGKRYLNSLGASLVPALVRQTLAGVGQPYTTASDEDIPVYGGIKASLGQGDTRVGLFGTTSRQTVGGAVGVATGGTVGVPPNDPIINKMIEVGAYHQKPELSDEIKARSKKEQVAFQIGKGRLQKQFVENVVLNPGFAGLDPKAQKRLIDKAFKNASELANKRAKAIIKLKGVVSEQAIFKGRT